ncbi:MAG: hypothetical protein RBT01_13510 [Anaerolineaceae bacterium]|jgi:isopropylmalate/homocitrate/citramalate synthase|nr:hypothetical protein [Anaerolineaceae bacterium]
MKIEWTSKDYSVSPENYAVIEENKEWLSKKIKIHDVTLRDGEQQIGVGFRKEEKIAIAEKLAECGIHRIEAGMPATSKDDAEAIKQIVNKNLGPEIFAFCRSVLDDIKTAKDCGVHGVVVEIPSSEHMIQYSYQWTVEKAVDLVVNATNLAHELGLRVVLFTMDSTRARFDWLSNLILSVKKDGYFDSLALVDTQGVISPTACRKLVRNLKSIIDKPLEGHFHNDLGLANANSLAAMEEGVDIIHSTVLGMGPRAGQTATEQIVVALKLLYGIDAGIKIEKLNELAQLVSKFAPHQIPLNQPLIGDSLYKIESGIPASWWIRIKEEHPLAFYGILPSLVGREEVSIVLGKGSGLPSIKYWLAKLGLDTNEELYPEILMRTKKLAVDKKGLVTGDEFSEIVKNAIGESV